MQMLSRASSHAHHHLPSSSHGFSTIRLSLNSLPIPFVSLSPSSSLSTRLRFRRLHLSASSSPSSTSASFLSSSGKTLRNSYIPSLFSGLLSSSSCFSTAPFMAGRPSLAAKASFNTEGNSGGSREILVQHLLVKENDLNVLVEIQKRIAEGEDLSDLAADYSICPSKEDGGMLGWVKRGQMVPEFEEAAFSAPLDKVVRCKTKFGWHLLQVLSEREELVLQEIRPNELHEKLQDPHFSEEAQLIDVREPAEIEKASLPGFKVLPLQQFGSWAPEITTQFDPDKDTYVLCHHGMRSFQVAKWLQTQGFKRVINVAGGIHAYAVEVDPSIPTY